MIVVRDQSTKNGLGALNITGARRYIAQIYAVENPWNYTPAVCTTKEIEATKPASLLTEPVENCSVALVFIVELKVAASMDQDLDCVGIISGGRGQWPPTAFAGLRSLTADASQSRTSRPAGKEDRVRAAGQAGK